MPTTAPAEPVAASQHLNPTGPPLRVEQQWLTQDGWQQFKHRCSQRPRFRLQRESEVPKLLAAMGAEDALSAESAAEGDGQRPDALVGQRQERRQILAIARVVCQATAEVLVGLRPAAQLDRWLEAEVHHKVRQRAAITARQAADSTLVRPQALRFRAGRAVHLRPGVWEVTVVFSDERRTRACALRLQAHRRRWRVTAMELG
ncbi:Rv3235 family protein [Nesterenkonia ebinurensis]|uniref:Rv3235 family protein n=1 Tax=Nesterenkonia ebinurensis TaxID=2608252 RepID=UPI00123CC2A4|nr:Rv3235 family protein [Nesterenkonia ebinurensis]